MYVVVSIMEDAEWFCIHPAVHGPFKDSLTADVFAATLPEHLETHIVPLTMVK